MSKKNNTPLKIFTESIKLYFSNFDKFIKYMTFPVLGQILGLILIFLLVYFYSVNIPTLIEKFPNLNNFNTLILTIILLTLPGLIIFTKAFWEYLVAYGAINSMLQNMLKSGRVYDFDAHTELVKRRSFSFIGIWLIFGLISFLLIIPLLFWIPYTVLMIYLALTFQAFTFDPALSPIGCMKKSFNLIKGHFASTFLLLALVGALTYSVIPNLVTFIFDIKKLTETFSKVILPTINFFPLDTINSLLHWASLPPLEASAIARFFILTFIFQISIQYTLPIRSIACALWYKELNSGFSSELDLKPRKRRSKKPSDKLMESSRKKYSSKKIDRNILKRAMEKEDN